MAIGAVGAWVAANAATITAATAAASAVYTGVNARKQAKQQEEYQKSKNEAALKSMQDQYSQLSGAEKDARDRALEQSMENQSQYARRKSKIGLMAAASGTQGLSVDSMVRDLRQQKGRNMNTIIKNQSIELQGFRNQAESIRVGAASRIDNRKIQRPSWGEIGLSAGSSALSGYSAGKAMQPSGGGGNPGATMGANSWASNTPNRGGV